MNSRAIFGISIAAVFVIAMVATVEASHTTPSYLTATSTSAPYSSFSMTVASPIPHLTTANADHLITFWSWLLPSDSDGFIKVAAIAIHHGVNDHVVFGQAVRSDPVQSFHPHIVKVDGATGCVMDLKSPEMDFSVKGSVLTLEASGFEGVPGVGGLPAGVPVNGWLGPRADCISGVGLV